MFGVRFWIVFDVICFALMANSINFICVDDKVFSTHNEHIQIHTYTVAATSTHTHKNTLKNVAMTFALLLLLLLLLMHPIVLTPFNYPQFTMRWNPCSSESNHFGPNPSPKSISKTYRNTRSILFWFQWRAKESENKSKRTNEFAIQFDYVKYPNHWT